MQRRLNDGDMKGIACFLRLVAGTTWRFIYMNAPFAIFRRLAEDEKQASEKMQPTFVYDCMKNRGIPAFKNFKVESFMKTLKKTTFNEAEVNRMIKNQVAAKVKLMEKKMTTKALPAPIRKKTSAKKKCEKIKKRMNDYKELKRKQCYEAAMSRAGSPIIYPLGDTLPGGSEAFIPESPPAILGDPVHGLHEAFVGNPPFRKKNRITDDDIIEEALKCSEEMPKEDL